MRRRTSKALLVLVAAYIGLGALAQIPIPIEDEHWASLDVDNQALILEQYALDEVPDPSSGVPISVCIEFDLNRDGYVDAQDADLALQLFFDVTSAPWGPCPDDPHTNQDKVPDLRP